MTHIEFHKDDYNSAVNVEADIICVEPLNGLVDIISTSLVTLTSKEWQIKVRFDWKDDTELSESDFLYIPEKNVIFFKSMNQWGVIDINSRKLKRHEIANWSPFIEKNETYIYIQDDLTAEATNLSGDRIDSVPIDPPTEMKEFEDRIEFNSPIMGHQILKIKQ